MHPWLCMLLYSLLCFSCFIDRRIFLLTFSFSLYASFFVHSLEELDSHLPVTQSELDSSIQQAFETTNKEIDDFFSSILGSQSRLGGSFIYFSAWVFTHIPSFFSLLRVSFWWLRQLWQVIYYSFFWLFQKVKCTIAKDLSKDIRDFKKTDQAVLHTCDIPVRFFRPFGPFIITGNQANYLNWGVILL
jgi:hypothetical protein